MNRCKYSVIINNAYLQDANSVLGPITNSASASGMSNGTRSVSATLDMKKIKPKTRPIKAVSCWIRFHPLAY